MASFTFSSVAQVFPVGTTVGAYLRSDWSTATLPPSGAPPGSAVTTAAVASNGSLAFSGLAVATRYYAAAQVGGVWKYVAFTSPAAAASDAASRVLGTAYGAAGAPSVIVVNSAADANVCVFAIPSTIAAGDVLLLLARGDVLNNSAAAVTLAFKLKLGSTTIWTMSGLSMAQNANRRQWRVSADVNVEAPATRQWCGASAVVTANSASTFPIGTGSSSGEEDEVSTVDLTPGVNLTLVAALGTADALADVRLKSASLIVVKAAA